MISATSRAFERRRGSNRQAARHRYSSYQSAILRRLAPMVSTSNVVQSVSLVPVPGACGTPTSAPVTAGSAGKPELPLLW